MTTPTNVLLRELAVNAARKARRWQERGMHEHGLKEVAESIENWLHYRAPLLPGYDPDWQECPKSGEKVYEFPWEGEFQWEGDDTDNPRPEEDDSEGWRPVYREFLRRFRLENSNGGSDDR